MITCSIPKGEKLEDVTGKRVYGQHFKNRVFLLCSVNGIRQGFLEWVQYYVVEWSSGCVLSVEETKGAAISSAREAIQRMKSEGRWVTLMRRHVPVCYGRRKARELECRRIWEQVEAMRKPIHLPPRRQKVFDKSGGKCHYCAVSLELFGDWHIEHQTPRSRGGADRLDNMVASCVPCNRSKGSKTEHEFKASIAA